MPKTIQGAARPKKRATTSKTKKRAVPEVAKRRPFLTRWRRPADVAPPAHVPNVISLSRTTTQLLWRYKLLFLGITAVYAALNIVLVQNVLTNRIIGSLENHTINAGVSGFFTLLGSGSSSNGQGSFQFILFVIASLATIWALRQVSAGHEPGIKQTYYKGMYPLVPFMLVLLVIGVELLPLSLGAALYSIIISNDIAVNVIEKGFWALVFAGFAAVTLYLIASSLIAAYIVTLADMTPLKALRAARDLTRYRRWVVLRKILFLPLALLLIAAIIIVPVIIILPAIAQVTFFILSMLALTIGHSYLYTLYRELIGE